MSVSVSQIGIDRSIDQSRFPGQSLDQSICVCRCLYKETTPAQTRSHFRRKILRPVYLFSLLISSPRPFARLYLSTKAQLHRSYFAIMPKVTLRIFSIAKRRTRREIHDAGCTCEKLRARICAEEHDEESQESGTESGGYQRPSWVPRTKLTHHVNCLSTTLPVYIYRYINILCIYVHTHICVRVYNMCVHTCACVCVESATRILVAD